jgi:hypothetical protein
MSNLIIKYGNKTTDEFLLGMSYKATLVTLSVFAVAQVGSMINGGSFLEHYAQASTQSNLASFLSLPMPLYESAISLNIDPLVSHVKEMEKVLPLVLAIPVFGCFSVKMLSFATNKISAKHAKITNESPINFYIEEMRKLGGKEGAINKKIISTSGLKNSSVQNALALFRENFLTKGFVKGIGDINQSQINAVHLCALMKISENDFPDIKALLKDDVFDNPYFDYVFENATSLGKSLEGNIGNFTQYAQSVFQSLGGHENNVFGTKPNDMERNVSIVRQYQEMTMNALVNGHKELDQRHVMLDVIEKISETMVKASVKRASRNPMVIDIHDASLLSGTLAMSLKVMKRYDSDTRHQHYQSLIDTLDPLLKKLNTFIDSSNNGQVDLSSIARLKAIAGNKGDTLENVIERAKSVFTPDVDYEAKIDGLSSKYLMEDLSDNVLVNDPYGTTTQEVVMDISKKALVDYIKEEGQINEVKHTPHKRRL